MPPLHDYYAEGPIKKLCKLICFLIVKLRSFLTLENVPKYSEFGRKQHAAHDVRKEDAKCSRTTEDTTVSHPIATSDISPSHTVVKCNALPKINQKQGHTQHPTLKNVPRSNLIADSQKVKKCKTSLREHIPTCRVNIERRNLSNTKKPNVDLPLPVQNKTCFEDNFSYGGLSGDAWDD